MSSQRPARKVAGGPALDLLSATQKHYVYKSFMAIEPIAEEVAARFYQRLFEVRPDLRSLFHGDMESQQRKLLGMIKIVVGSLDRPETILPVIKVLGERHRGFAVEAEHYRPVEEALISALRSALGDALDPVVEEAWRRLFEQISAIMMSAGAN